jgi:D-alanine--poly(phosphoribitol) ligase subunit 2
MSETDDIVRAQRVSDDIAGAQRVSDDIARAQRVFEDALSVSAPAPDVDVIESGLIDSLGLVTLLFELEQEFDVRVPLESLEVEDFRTVGNMVRTIHSLKREGQLERR